jgi:hypothetical protein
MAGVMIIPAQVVVTIILAQAVMTITPVRAALLRAKIGTTVKIKIDLGLTCGFGLTTAG